MPITNIPGADQKNATLSLKLRADSGYKADSNKHRVSANEWAAIISIAEGTRTGKVLLAAPETLTALTELWSYAQKLQGIIRDGVYRSEELKDPDAWKDCDAFAYNGDGASMREIVEAALAKSGAPA